MKRIIVPLIICLLYSIASSWWLSGDSLRAKIKMKMHNHAASKLLFVNPSDSLVDTSDIYYDDVSQKTRFPASIYFDPTTSHGIYIDTNAQVFFISFAASGPEEDSGAYFYMESDASGGDMILSPGVSGNFTVKDNIIIDNGASYSEVVTASGATCSRLTLWPYGITNGGAFHIFSGSGDTVNSIIETSNLEIRDKGNSGDLSISFGDEIFFHTDLFKVLGSFEIHSGNNDLIFGADDGDTSITDDNDKSMGIGFPHYDVNEEPVCAIYCKITSTNSDVCIGGGISNFNSTRRLHFYTYDNTTQPLGTEQMRIEGDGGIFAYNLATGVGGETDLVINGSDEILLKSSSKRYKKNIKEIELNSSILQKFKIHGFTWKKSGKEDFGFIAEELAENFPGIETYVDGKIQSWDTQKMMILAVAEIQRLNKKVEAHEIKIWVAYVLIIIIGIYSFVYIKRKHK